MRKSSRPEERWQDSPVGAWRKSCPKRRITYDVRANWKLIVANYNECLHCPFQHSTLNRLTGYLGLDNEPAQLTYIGGFISLGEPAQTMSTDGKRRDNLPGLSEPEH